MTEPLFHERQYCRMIWVWALVVVVAATAWMLFGGYLFLGLDLGSDPPPRWLAVALLGILGVLFPLSLVLFRLDITVAYEELRFSMGPFFFRRFPLREIARAEAVQYRPMRDYLGWGIKWMPGRGWSYTVDGDRGVRVQLVSGRTFLLGSRRPDELAAALAAHAPATM